MSKVALVTGASRGIGRSIAEALAAAGYAVVVNFAFRREEAEATVAAISTHGGTALAVPADVSDPGAVARMFAVIDDRFGRLDALVNNAGIGRRFGAHYAASKAGLLALTAKAARELARDGISVNAVLPSVIETEMLDAVAPDAASRSHVMAQFPIGRFGRPEEVAQVVRFLVVEAPDYLTGEFISLRGGRL